MMLLCILTNSGLFLIWLRVSLNNFRSFVYLLLFGNWECLIFLWAYFNIRFLYTREGRKVIHAHACKMRTWWAIEVWLVAFVRNILKHHPTLVCRFRGCLESIWQRSSTYLARNWRVNTKAANWTDCSITRFYALRFFFILLYSRKASQVIYYILDNEVEPANKSWIVLKFTFLSDLATSFRWCCTTLYARLFITSSYIFLRIFIIMSV